MVDTTQPRAHGEEQASGEDQRHAESQQAPDDEQAQQPHDASARLPSRARGQIGVLHLDRELAGDL